MKIAQGIQPESIITSRSKRIVIWSVSENLKENKNRYTKKIGDVLLDRDKLYVEINETIQLNGQTPVITTKSYLRVFRAYVEQAGSGETNDGNESREIRYHEM